MKVNDPTKIKFPFNVNSENEFHSKVNKLNKLGYTKLSFEKVKMKFPIRFTCINNNPNNLTYMIY